jgi:hypothetical protein
MYIGNSGIKYPHDRSVQAEMRWSVRTAEDCYAVQNILYLINSTKDSVFLHFHGNSVYMHTAQCYITDSLLLT